jgi:hypothetical protein
MITENKDFGVESVLSDSILTEDAESVTDTRPLFSTPVSTSPNTVRKGALSTKGELVTEGW